MEIEEEVPQPILDRQKKREARKKKGKKRKTKETIARNDVSEEEGDEVDLRPNIERLRYSMKSLKGQLPPPSSDEFICQISYTALLLPFKWSNPTTAVLSIWINELLKRKVASPNGTILPLYDESRTLPEAVADLDPHFRKTLGWTEDDDNEFEEFEPYDDDLHDVAADEVSRRVFVRPEALDIVFPSPGLVAKHGDQLIQQKIKIEGIEIVCFPLGTAVLKLIVNWLPNKKDKLTLDEFRSWLYLSKFRQKVEGFEGWLLDTEPETNSYNSREQDSLGTRLCKALHCEEPVSLTAIGNWLLVTVDENVEKPPQRLGRFAKRAYHHTVVVIDREPATPILEEYLFHLKRAYGQRNRPPPLYGEERHSTPCELHPRSNRYIGVSREGTISLSWPSKEDQRDDYEVQKWHKVFLGVYLTLATHVQGEKAILQELSNLSAHAGSLLKQISWEVHMEEALKNISKMRRELGHLASLMTRYTLQMSSDNCGGLSEYVEFFTSLRDIFGIRKQRSELREEIQDVLALVESSYLEEQRKYSELSQWMRKEEKRLSKIRDEKITENQTKFQNIFTITSIFTLPIVIVGGTFGMNNLDLPVELPFFPTMAVTLSVSFFLLIVFGVVLMRHNKKYIREPTLPDTRSRLSLSLDYGDRSLSLDMRGRTIDMGDRTLDRDDGSVDEGDRVGRTLDMGERPLDRGSRSLDRGDGSLDRRGRTIDMGDRPLDKGERSYSGQWGSNKNSGLLEEDQDEDENGSSTCIPSMEEHLPLLTTQKQRREMSE